MAGWIETFALATGELTGAWRGYISMALFMGIFRRKHIPLLWGPSVGQKGPQGSIRHHVIVSDSQPLPKMSTS